MSSISLTIKPRWKQRAQVQGRDYKDLKTAACWECKRTINELQKLTLFLRACGYAQEMTARHLVCGACLETHEYMHELAGDKQIVHFRRYNDYVSRGI